MKNIFLIFFLAVSAAVSSAQQANYRYTFQQLREFEGIYQYVNHTTLKMAASPNEIVLYAIVNQTRYALKAIGRDSFLTNANQSINFLRGNSHQITGYAYKGETLKLLNKNVKIPSQMWYPRSAADASNKSYKYQIPVALGDGLPTANVAYSGLDSTLLNTMVKKIIAGDYPNVHSILIVKDGKLVFEEYFYEFTRDSVQEQRSATKSVISALTGIAISQGHIKSVNEMIFQYFPDYHPANNSELKQKITVGDLLSNQSGVSFDEAYDKAAGNETDMGYTDDWVKYTFDLPLIDTPGSKGRYNSGNPITLGRIIEITSSVPLRDYAIKNLFGPMGISNFKWRFKPDKSESEDYCQLYMRPRDMAKFGLLYLNNGLWNNRQLLPAEWVATSTSKHAVVQGVDYGYLWWLKYLDADGTRYFSFAAQGNGGQKTYIFRPQHLVVVVTGGNYNTPSPSNELVKKFILPAFNKNR
jgi:CubicO group peptidase (beta-lactamase class C family)